MTVLWRIFQRAKATGYPRYCTAMRAISAEISDCPWAE